MGLQLSFTKNSGHWQPKFKNSSFRLIVNYIVLYLIIYISDDAFLFGTNKNSLFLILKVVFYIVLIILNIILINKYKQLSITILLLLILNIIFTSIANNDFSLGYFYQCITLILGFLITQKFSFDHFFKAFFNVILTISSLSIVAYLFVIIFPEALNYFPTVVNIADKSAHNLFISVMLENDGYSLIRNSSFFREPGVFVVYLNIALIFGLFKIPNCKSWQILIILFSLITSFSTAGIIVATIILITYLIQSSTSHKYIKRKNIVYFLIVAFLFVMFNESINNKIFGKLEESSYGYRYSTLGRIVSFFVPINIFFDNILLGSGLDSFAKKFTEYSIKIFGVSFLSGGTATNTFLNKFATYGLSFGSIFIFSSIRFSKKIYPYNNYLISTLLFISFFLMFSNEDMRNSITYNIIFFYGINFLK